MVRVLPASECFSTSRLGVLLTRFGAVAGGSLYYLTAYFAPTEQSLVLQSLLLIPVGLTLAAVLGAAGGALLALLSGATLSRANIILFAAATGTLAVPITTVVFLQTLVRYPPLLLWFVGAGGSTLEYLMGALATTLSIAIFTAWGAMIMRNRRGMSRASRRGAILGALWGATACGLILLAWYVMDHVRLSMNSGPSVNVSLVIDGQWKAVPCLVLIAAAIGAIVRSDRADREARFDVVPLAPVAAPVLTDAS